jgi:hypothetical protein
MKKMIFLLIVVGILVFGTFCVDEEMGKDISLENVDVSEESFEDPGGNVVPCGGGGGNGGGGIPG